MPCSDSSGLFWIVRQELKQFPFPGSPDQHLLVPGDPLCHGFLLFSLCSRGNSLVCSAFIRSRRFLLSFYQEQEAFLPAVPLVLLAQRGSRVTELTQGSAPLALPPGWPKGQPDPAEPQPGTTGSAGSEFHEKCSLWLQGHREISLLLQHSHQIFGWC